MDSVPGVHCSTYVEKEIMIEGVFVDVSPLPSGWKQKERREGKKW